MAKKARPVFESRRFTSRYQDAATTATRTRYMTRLLVRSNTVNVPGLPITRVRIELAPPDPTSQLEGNSQASHIQAKIRVATARYRPRTRRATAPSRAATPAVITAARGRLTGK